MIHSTNLNKQQSIISSHFFETIFEDMGAILVTKKLDKWYNLSYTEFCIELARMKVSPAKVTKRNWEEYFSEQRQKINELFESSHSSEALGSPKKNKELVFN